MSADSRSPFNAKPGDRIIVHGHRQGEAARDAEILEVLGDDGAPPYLVRWEDGRESEIFPGPDIVIQHFDGGGDEAQAGKEQADA
jgi:Domain of unknown function (DUF1918)